LLSVVLGIIIQALFALPVLYYVPLMVIAFVMSVWKYHFLCVAVFALAALNLEYNRSVDIALTERDMEYSGVVLAEESYEHYTRLFIRVDRVLFSSDTVFCAFPVEYYAHEHGQFLGKRVTVKGKVRGAKRIYRPAVLTGEIIESIGREHIFGVVFSPIRKYIDRLLSGFFDLERYSIASGLTLGGSGRLSRELKDVFSRAGTLHILAVSGLHVGFVGAFFGAVLLFIPLDYRAKFIIVICALFMYAGVTGFRPSVCRATLMAFLFGLALVSQRNVDSMHIVNITATVFLLVNPVLLFDVGAQLSFAAVYGILYLYPILEDNFIKKTHTRFLKGVLRMMAVSFSAQLFVGPLLIYYFNRLPVYAVVANLLIVPLASAIIFMLFLCFTIGWISFTFARIIALPAGILIDVLTILSNFFAGLRFSALKLNITPLVIFPLYLLAWKRIRKLMLWSVMVLVLLLSVAWSVDCLIVCASPRGIFIAMPDDTRIYITDRVSAAQRAFLQKHGVDAVDYLVAGSRSHPVKRDFVEWPEDLHFLGFECGDLEIAIYERLQIKYRGCKMEYSRSFFDEQPDDGKIRYILSNGKVCHVVEGSLYNTIFEQMIVDLRTAVARIRLLFCI